MGDFVSFKIHILYRKITLNLSPNTKSPATLFPCTYSKLWALNRRLMQIAREGEWKLSQRTSLYCFSNGLKTSTVASSCRMWKRKNYPSSREKSAFIHPSMRLWPWFSWFPQGSNEWYRAVTLEWARKDPFASFPDGLRGDSQRNVADWRTPLIAFLARSVCSIYEFLYIVLVGIEINGWNTWIIISIMLIRGIRKINFAIKVSSLFKYVLWRGSR